MKQKLLEIVHATVPVFIYFDKIRKTKQLWVNKFTYLHVFWPYLYHFSDFVKT